MQLDLMVAGLYSENRGLLCVGQRLKKLLVVAPLEFVLLGLVTSVWG